MSAQLPPGWWYQSNALDVKFLALVLRPPVLRAIAFENQEAAQV
jgi:hypothetical protein